MMVLQENRNT